MPKMEMDWKERITSDKKFLLSKPVINKNPHICRIYS
jgi:hypothetical protein